MDVEKTFSFNFTKAWTKASTTPSLGCVVLTLEDRFEINPSGTECYGNFIGFTEEETGFDYTYDNKYEGDDPDEDPSEYVGYDGSTGIVEIEEEGYYIIGDPCSIEETDTEVYLKEGKYKICFFSNNIEY